MPVGIFCRSMLQFEPCLDTLRLPRHHRGVSWSPRRDPLNYLRDWTDEDLERALLIAWIQGLGDLLTTLLHDPAASASKRVAAERIDALIADIDRRLSAQVNAILHTPEVKALETSWRGVKYLVDEVDFRANVRIELLQATKEDLLSDFRDAPEVTHAGLYRTIYKDAFGVFGGKPYGVVCSVHDFGPGAEDVELLRSFAQVGAIAHVPFLGNVNASMFGIGSFEDIPRLTERQSEDAPYVPCFMLRAPYGSRESELKVRSFNFSEDVIDRHENFLWGPASIVLEAPDRLLERHQFHDDLSRVYWLSYDFVSNVDVGSVFYYLAESGESIVERERLNEAGIESSCGCSPPERLGRGDLPENPNPNGRGCINSCQALQDAACRSVNLSNDEIPGGHSRLHQSLVRGSGTCRGNASADQGLCGQRAECSLHVPSFYAASTWHRRPACTSARCAALHCLRGSDYSCLHAKRVLYLGIGDGLQRRAAYFCRALAGGTLRATGAIQGHSDALRQSRRQHAEYFPGACRSIDSAIEASSSRPLADGRVIRARREGSPRVGQKIRQRVIGANRYLAHRDQASFS